MSELCVCGYPLPFVDCCSPYLAGDALAPTAEALMRSRYSAFCRGNIDYLLATHRSNQPPKQPNEQARADLRKTINSTQWLHLVVLNTQKGTTQDTTGTVEFACAYRPKAKLAILSLGVTAEPVRSQIQQMHERSKFVKDGGQWFYTTGEMLPPYQPKKSQPCWCGSQKKFKRCHG